MTYSCLDVKISSFCDALMNKYLKLLAIPLAVIVLDGCAPFHNVLRNIRHSIERATRKKDSDYRKILASSIACRENLDRSLRAARNDVRQQLDDKRIREEDVDIETVPKEAPEIEWPNLDVSDTYGSVCAMAMAYKAKPKPTPKPKKPEETLPPEPEVTEIQSQEK